MDAEELLDLLTRGQDPRGLKENPRPETETVHLTPEALPWELNPKP
jgi:hypothetical protein